MRRIVKRTSRKIGLPPGSIVHIGEQIIGKPKVTVIDYDEENYLCKELEDLGECQAYKDKSTITWINITGLHEIEIIKKVGECFGLHDLVQEDIADTAHRPKVEDYDDYIFIILKILKYNKEKNEIEAEQISLVLGANFVLSFQERESDLFDQIRERLSKAKNRLRKLKADFLAYSLIDAIVDGYFLILEKFGESVEDLEDAVISEPDSKNLQTLQYLRRETLILRKSVWPLREIVNHLVSTESDLIQEKTTLFFRDIYDHIVQVIENTETLREILTSLFDIYLSSLSNKLNQIMKVLAAIATIFMPLTLIAGIYGMNFQYMPELGWHFGYPMILVIMLGIGVSMLAYFKRKKWF